MLLLKCPFPFFNHACVLLLIFIGLHGCHRDLPRPVYYEMHNGVFLRTSPSMEAPKKEGRLVPAYSDVKVPPMFPIDDKRVLYFQNNPNPNFYKELQILDSRTQNLDFREAQLYEDETRVQDWEKAIEEEQKQLNENIEFFALEKDAFESYKRSWENNQQLKISALLSEKKLLAVQQNELEKNKEDIDIRTNLLSTKESLIQIREKKLVEENQKILYEKNQLKLKEKILDKKEKMIDEELVKMGKNPKIFDCNKVSLQGGELCIRSEKRESSK